MEMVIVVFIIGALAAISTPFYLRHVNKAIAQEAVSMMAMIREALRDYHINNNVYYDVQSGNLPNLPTSGVGIDAGVAQYFSNHCYTVRSTQLSSPRFTNPGPKDFIIHVDGSASVACGSSNCALKSQRVSQFQLEMDNTGRIFVSYDGGVHWQSY